MNANNDTINYRPFWQRIRARILELNKGEREVEAALGIAQGSFSKWDTQNRSLRRKFYGAKSQLAVILKWPESMLELTSELDAGDFDVSVDIPVFSGKPGHMQDKNEAIKLIRSRVKRENCYGIYAQDNANYPKIFGITETYEGDIVIFQRGKKVYQGDVVHIEITMENGDRRWAIRELARDAKQRAVLQTVNRNGDFQDYPYHTKKQKAHIKVLGVFVELRRESWPR